MTGQKRKIRIEEAAEAVGPGNEPDRELILLVRAGDLDAFGVLFERHRRAATRSARRTVDATTADDVVAEAFASVLRQLLAGRGPTDLFLPYLLRVVRNAAIDIWQQRTDIPIGQPEDTACLWGCASADPGERVPRELATRQAMMSLPPRWRRVLWLLEVEGHDRQTVGRIMGLQPDAVSSLALRARRGLLRAYLAREPPRDGHPPAAPGTDDHRRQWSPRGVRRTA